MLALFSFLRAAFQRSLTSAMVAPVFSILAVRA